MKRKEKNIERDKEGFVKINWGRQGNAFLAFLIILLGYYGIIANLVMLTPYGTWISYLDMNKTILIWPYTVYLDTYFLPAILLYITCFFVTYREDIALYGFKLSIWLIPILVGEGFIFYWFMFGVVIIKIINVSFILQFLRFEGYLNILQLLIFALSGAYSGMKLKNFIIHKKQIKLN